MDSRDHQLVDAYVFGYPLVYDLSSVMAISANGMGSLPPAPFNSFAFGGTLATPDDRFVSVNNDTVYVIAQLDLSGGPVLLHVPDTGGRYYVLQFVDAWTNNFAYVGSRATGTGEGEFLIAGPGWSGDVPEGARLITAPTDVATIVGRLATDGGADLEHAVALQQGFTLTPLEGNGVPRGIPHPSPDVPDALKFWEMLRLWSLAFPPGAEDQAVLASLSDYGLTDLGEPYLNVSRELEERLAAGFAAGRAHVEEIAASGDAPTVNGWRANPHMFDYNLDHFEIGAIDSPEWKLADRTASYAQRAIAARNGLWGNHGYEAVYSEVFVDADGAQLNGAHRYELRLEELPPADAFWSITMYDMPDYYLVANPIERYSIGDRTPGIVTGHDGALTITMQHEQPADAAAAANWLPSPAGDFRPMLRVYAPRQDVIDGTFRMPPITRVG